MALMYHNCMFNFFKKQPKGTGANIDTRSEQEKSKDYKFEELVANTIPVNWVEKPASEWRKFPIFNQNGSGSCVAQTMAKLMGIMYWLKNGIYVHFSSAHIYQRRSNRPIGGMAGVEAFNIARQGVTLEELAPSQNLNDAQMDAVNVEDYKQKVGEIFKIGNFLVVPIGDIDTVASIIQTTQKGVMVWFYFKNDEWTTRPTVKYPELDVRGATTARHSVTAVDFALVGGKKCLIISDSWGSSYGQAGQRIIDEDFFKARNFFVAYPMNFAFEEGTTKPKYTFSKDLNFEQTDPDIKALQDILKYEAFFPVNTNSTGYYGAVTAKAVLAFQQKYKVASEAELIQLAGRIVGVKTREKLNELYG